MKRYALLLFLSSAVACSNDYSVELPGSYELARISPGRIVIADPSSRVIVGPSEFGLVIGVSGKFVYGNLDTEEDAYNAPEVADRYFIIDTESSKVFSELSEKRFIQLLIELGIRHAKMGRPNALTKFAT